MTDDQVRIDGFVANLGMKTSYSSSQKPLGDRVSPNKARQAARLDRFALFAMTDAAPLVGLGLRF